MIRRTAQKLTARHPFPTITYTPTEMLPAELLQRAGAVLGPA